MGNLEVIERYINSELNETELNNFENLLLVNKDVKRDYNLCLNINKAISEEDVMNLRKTMHEIFKNKKQDQIHIFQKRIRYAAASLILLIVTGGVINKIIPSNLDYNKVFEKYYTPYKATDIFRSGNTQTDKILLNAINYYVKHDFAKALILFEEVIKVKENDIAVNFYLGISYIEQEKYTKASISFNSVIINNDNLFIEQAKWYLSLCYLKTKQKNNATNLLNELVSEKSSYASQAKEMLEQIEKLN
ncbi:MAG: hypothetical protein MI739_09035 [Bacteroidales bacterium]|nr:hypothetical protein [Bacteroidales bacterium]